MKTCFKCKMAKPLTDFYRHAKMADGHLNKCKDCAKKDVRINYRATRKQYAAYERMRNQTPERRKRKLAYQYKHRKNHPERLAARQAVKRALRSGKLFRQPCIHCGNPETQAHHKDYRKPLEVIWCCFQCHRQHEHQQTVVFEGNPIKRKPIISPLTNRS